jgi:hypothetical protein
VSNPSHTISILYKLPSVEDCSEDIEDIINQIREKYIDIEITLISDRFYY